MKTKNVELTRDQILASINLMAGMVDSTAIVTFDNGSEKMTFVDALADLSSMMMETIPDGFTVKGVVSVSAKEAKENE